MSTSKTIFISSLAAVLIFVFGTVLIRELTTRQVPTVRFMGQEAARALVTAQRLSPYVAERRDPTTTPGHVIEQVPPPGTVVGVGGIVVLVVATGGAPTAPSAEMVAVPPLAGAPKETARFALESAGLQLGTVTEQEDDRGPGMVISSDPPSGARAPKGTAVQLVVSAGPSGDPKRVPSVVGRTRSRAESILTKRGFRMGEVRYSFSEDQMFDRVLSQYPRAGARAKKGSRVDLTINREVGY